MSGSPFLSSLSAVVPNKIHSRSSVLSPSCCGMRRHVVVSVSLMPSSAPGPSFATDGRHRVPSIPSWENVGLVCGMLAQVVLMLELRLSRQECALSTAASVTASTQGETVLARESCWHRGCSVSHSGTVGDSGETPVISWATGIAGLAWSLTCTTRFCLHSAACCSAGPLSQPSNLLRSISLPRALWHGRRYGQQPIPKCRQIFLSDVADTPRALAAFASGR